MGLTLVALAAMGCAILMWTGYPPDFKGPIATPSVDGMRFFPLAALLFFIMRPRSAASDMDAVGHAPVAPGRGVVARGGVLRHDRLVALSRAEARSRPSARRARPSVAIAVMRGAVVAIVATAVAFAALASCSGLVYHQWPSIAGFTAYIRNPPGILPANPTGPIWLALAAAAVVADRSVAADARGIRVGFVCLMGLLGGRLLLSGAQPRQQRAQSPAVRRARADGGAGDRLEGCRLRICSGRACGPGGATGDVWLRILERSGARAAKPGISGRAISSTTCAWPRRSLSRLLDASLAQFDKRDIAGGGRGSRAGMAAHARGEGTPVWVSPSMFLPFGDPGAAWTAMSDVGAFTLLPQDEVGLFIRNGAPAPESARMDRWSTVRRQRRGPRSSSPPIM